MGRRTRLKVPPSKPAPAPVDHGKLHPVIRATVLALADNDMRRVVPLARDGIIWTDVTVRNAPARGWTWPA